MRKTNNARAISRPRKRLAVVIGHCLALGNIAAAGAANILVAAGEVATANNGLCSIVEAINNANADDQSGSPDCIAGDGNDRIFLSAGSDFVFTEADPSGRALPVISSNITFEGNDTTLRRDASAPAFGLMEVTAFVTFSSATLSNGSVSGDGGGIYVNGGRFDLRRATLTGNTAGGNGGGFSCANGGSVYLTNGSIVSNNSAGTNGGGIHCIDGAVEISYGLVTQNTATDGGGLFASGGSVTIRSRVVENTATASGGGAFIENADANLSSARVNRNTAGASGGGIRTSGGSLNAGYGGQFVENTAALHGGAIWAQATDLTLGGTTIARNQATNGGGLRVADNTVTLTRGEIADNISAGRGGGVYSSNGSLSLSDVTLRGNASQYIGAGVYGQGSALTVTDSTVSGNSSSDSGGGIAVAAAPGAASADISGSTFSNNAAASNGGGLIMAEGVTATIRNSTFGNNTAVREGAGIHGNETILTLEHVTFAGNEAGNFGENLWLGTSAGNVYMRNTLLGSGSSAGVDDCTIVGGSLDENEFNLSADGTCDENANGLIVADPLLAPLAPNGGTFTFGLLEGSPAIDAADAAACAADDQRGVTRSSAECDIGAFESTPPILVDELSPGVGLVAINIVDGLCSLPEALLNSTNNNQISTADGECEPGVENASDRVVLPQSAVFTLTAPDPFDTENGLPPLRSRTTIEGNGSEVLRDAESPFRLMYNSGDLTISDLTLSGGVTDRFDDGGAIASYGERVTLSEVTLRDNTSMGSGGALYVAGGFFSGGSELTISNSTISNNAAYSGGGISASGNATITNSTITGNTATSTYAGSSAGGIFSRYSGTLALINSTVAFNRTSSSGEGSSIVASNGLRLVNTLVVEDDENPADDCFIVTSDRPGDVSGEIIASVNSLVEDGTCNATFAGTGQPLLTPLADNGGPTQTHSLVVNGNPAIDNGDPLACSGLAFDQRGADFSRTLDGNDDGNAVCDIGAFESDGIDPNDIIFSDGFEP